MVVFLLFDGRKSVVRSLLIAATACVLVSCTEEDGGEVEPILANGQPNPEANITAEDASKFLVQASFGPTEAEINRVMDIGYSAWIREQLDANPSLHLTNVLARENAGTRGPHAHTDSFWEAATFGEDQLRQRMAFALSQIIVVSDASGSGLSNRPPAVAYYMDILTRNAFGTYRDILEEATYSPAMAIYLTYMRNRKADPRTGSVPDENYAREILQLFSIGLVELQSDGTPAPGNIETYTNADIEGLAKVFTGMAFANGRFFQSSPESYYSRLQLYPEYHSEEEKTFLGQTIPANTGPEESIRQALDHIFNHPNVPPFISRQLIQRFVTSNPTPAYVQRVAQAFESGTFTMLDGNAVGSGTRGDLSATIAAILLDQEARQSPDAADATSGKIREPILRFVHWARAFNVVSARAQDEGFLADTGDMDRLGQHPYRAPSVFNYYRPGYVAPNSESGETNLQAPELQIINETSAVGFTNFMSRYIRDQTPIRGDASGDSFRPNYSTELALADDPAALVEHLDLLLTYGRLSDDAKNRIISLLEEIQLRTDTDNEDSDRELRVHNAILMVVASPEFATQY